MSPQAQRIAIAELLGWKGPKHPDNIAGMAGWWSQNRDVWWLSPLGERVMISSVPDYLNDLNAMHEAEKVLTVNQRRNYGFHLACLFTDHPDDGVRFAIYATADQRSEAILRTLNLWDESK